MEYVEPSTLYKPQHPTVDDLLLEDKIVCDYVMGLDARLRAIEGQILRGKSHLFSLKSCLLCA